MSTTHTSRSAPAPANGGVRRLVGGIAARTAVRALALLVLFWGQMWLWDTFAPSTDANIGAGLLAFLTVVVLSGVWGLLDGRRHGLVGALAAWVLAASVFDAVAAVAQDSWDSFGFLTALSLVPALLGVLPGAAVRAARRS